MPEHREWKSNFRRRSSPAKVEKDLIRQKRLELDMSEISILRPVTWNTNFSGFHVSERLHHPLTKFGSWGDRKSRRFVRQNPLNGLIRFLITHRACFVANRFNQKLSTPCSTWLQHSRNKRAETKGKKLWKWWTLLKSLAGWFANCFYLSYTLTKSAFI